MSYLIKLPEVTDAILATLKNNYQGLKIQKEDQPILDLSDLSEKDAGKVSLDITFYLENPNLPLENLCSHLDNYHPRNESQEELLKYAHMILAIDDPSVTAGLWVYGEPGVGKSHIAVALAKQLMARNMETYFRFGEKLSRTELLGNNQTWVIDDLNKGNDYQGRVFTKIILNAHNVGGRIFVTSNKRYEDIMGEIFPNFLPSTKADKARYEDRTKRIFKILELTGESQREEHAWYN
jgi:DNA replication protein DnaC